MIAASDLRSSLYHFTGTTRYIRDPFTTLIHTDGIEHLAERAEAHWFPISAPYSGITRK